MGTNGNSQNDTIDPGGMDYVGRALGTQLGLGPSKGKDRSVTYDANGNPLIGGKPYDPNKIYTNPTKAEGARQVAIKLGTSAVNSVFDDPSRQGQYDAFLKSLRDYYTADANKQKGIVDRNLRFSMARSGLTGGSAAIDANRTVGEDYTKGLLDAENRSQDAYAGLRNQDEQTRLNLLSMVRSGMDTTTAAQRAGAAMQNNAQSAQTQALSQGLGDIFGSASSIYKSQQEADARRRGVRDATGSVYGPKNPYG